MKSRHDMQASLLDRLVDQSPGLVSESVQPSGFSFEQLKSCVARDLENLLNTRRQILVPPPECPEVGNSLYVYGLKDFTAENPGSLMIRQQLRQDIERSVTRFEPRLKNVRVHLEKEAGNERRLRYRITGLLVVAPISEPVSFDTFFDINRGQCSILK